MFGLNPSSSLTFLVSHARHLLNQYRATYTNYLASSSFRSHSGLSIYRTDPLDMMENDELLEVEPRGDVLLVFVMPSVP